MLCLLNDYLFIPKKDISSMLTLGMIIDWKLLATINGCQIR